MNAKESIVFMFKVHLPYAQATGNCAISLTITNCSNFNFFNPGGGGGGGQGTSAGRLVNFDSFSEISYRSA